MAENKEVGGAAAFLSLCIAILAAGFEAIVLFNSNYAADVTRALWFTLGDVDSTSMLDFAVCASRPSAKIATCSIATVFTIYTLLVVPAGAVAGSFFLVRMITLAAASRVFNIFYYVFGKRIYVAFWERPKKIRMFMFVDLLSMCTFSVYVSYVADDRCKKIGLVMLVCGWMFTVFFIHDFAREFQKKQELNGRLKLASRISIVIDVCGKVFTYGMAVAANEPKIPKELVALEFTTTLVEAMIKWKHTELLDEDHDNAQSADVTQSLL